MEERQYPYYTPEVNELFKALVQAKSKFKKAVLDSKGNYGRYASYESLVEATGKALEDYGLTVKQDPGEYKDKDALYSTLTHSSGQYSISCMILRTPGPDMQKLGGAITYGQRYAYAAILGIAVQEDDDGESNAQAFQKQENTSEPIQYDAYSPKQENMIRAKAKFSPQFLRQTCEELGIIANDVGELLPQLTKQTTRQLLNRICELEEQAKAGK